MTKLFFILHLLLSFNVFANCEVYGISDSPQKLTCQFGSDKVALSCKDKKYFLNQQAVDVAFHMEVEDGPNPLVFKTATSKLTVVASKGTWEEHQTSRQGDCSK